MAQQMQGLGEGAAPLSTSVTALGDSAVQGWQTTTAMMLGVAVGTTAAGMLIKRKSVSLTTGLSFPMLGGLLGFAGVWAWSKFKTPASGAATLSGYRLFGAR
jgi:hypothetical protein